MRDKGLGAGASSAVVAATKAVKQELGSLQPRVAIVLGSGLGFLADEVVDPIRIAYSTIRWTPGIGVRLHTGVGLLRVDVAYNPYQPVEGAAFYDAPVKSGGALFCVSPGNTLPVTVVSGVVTQATGTCPSSYQPPLQSSFFRRLAFVLTLGEAF